MKITLKDGSVKEYAEAKAVIEIAADISEGLARVACAGGILVLTEVQLEGKKRMDTDAFLRGYKIEKGSVFMNHKE